MANEEDLVIVGPGPTKIIKPNVTEKEALKFIKNKKPIGGFFSLRSVSNRNPEQMKEFGNVPVRSHQRRGTSGVISHRRLKPGR